MHAQQSGAQPATASMSEEERAALDSERTFAQAAAAAIDHEGRRGGGSLCDAADAVDRLQSAIADAHEPNRAQVQQLGMAFNSMPSELQRLDTAPAASFSAVSSESLNRVVSVLGLAREKLLTACVPLMVDALKVDRGIIPEDRKAQLRLAMSALLRGDLASPALSEQKLLLRGGATMFASLAAGNSSVTSDLLEALDKIAKLCTNVPVGSPTVFMAAREQIRELLGVHEVSPSDAAEYIDAQFKSIKSQFKKFR